MEIYVREHDNNTNYSDEPNALPQKVVFGTVLPPLATPLNEQAVRDEIGAGLDAIGQITPMLHPLFVDC